MSIKISLNHQISYTYDRPIILGPHTLGLRPSPHCRTPIQSYSLTIDPQDYTITWQQDPYGNYLARLNFPNRTDRLKIEVDLIAELQPINPFNFFVESYAASYPFTYQFPLSQELIPFLEVTESGDRLKNWIETHRQTNLYITNFLTTLNQQLSQEIEYQTRLEPGIQSCEQTLQKKVGSCRDTAWLLVQILRHYGLASRFVSGYLIQLKDDVLPLDGSPHITDDHSDLHAWAEVYLPGAGWIGLDPTSGFFAAEGHIPLVCTADAQAANPVQGSSESCESQLTFSITVSQHQETARVMKPYREEEWQKIHNLGQHVEIRLQELGVGLTMGGEPTFVSIDDFESSQWQVAALGDDKRKLAGKLLQSLEEKFAKKGGLLHYGLGKWYPGEALPRWALGCYWRVDEIPLWRNHKWYAEDGKNYGFTQHNAEQFIRRFVQKLGVDSGCIIPAYEQETSKIAGYVLPLLSVRREQTALWSSCRWNLPEQKLILLKGDSPVGFRLPMSSFNWGDGVLEEEAILLLDANPICSSPEPMISPLNSIRVAMSVEAREGTLHVFLPPLSSARSFVDLITLLEDTASQLEIPIKVEGYTPPENVGIIGFQITPDPGVIEVNIHPASNWDELVEITQTLYEEARLCRLGTEKYLLDGRRVSTGGGSHITIGGKTVEESPLLRRPDLLRSLITYWTNHPSLSYLFSGLFVGPTSQSPRIDEARYESLYELEIAFQYLQPEQPVPPELVDRLLRNLLIDITGNTHRTAFCIDKLYPVEKPRSRLGLLEFRAFAMPPHAQMALLQMLLIRAFVAWFWEKPYNKPLIRWGTTLHDRFMLPHYLREDLKAVITDLQSQGFAFELAWFDPFFEFRFPRYGAIFKEEIELELRHAIEPWHVLGEEIVGGGTARYVDSSMERIQVMLRGAMGNSPNLDSFSSRYLVACNGYPIPLKSTGTPGEYVGAVRFRARHYTYILHPAIDPDESLIFDIVDTWTERSIGGCTYYVNAPNGIRYQTFPINHREAQSRINERFVPLGHTPGKMNIKPIEMSPEYPLTLDLRRWV